MNLNDEQRTIINDLTGTIIVSAPVGTGKTTILAERVKALIAHGTDPARILCLTFTNRAADEMKQRIAELLRNKEVSDQVMVKTFHGFCAQFIKTEAQEIGVSADLVIFDESEQAEVMRRIVSGYPHVISETRGNEVMDLIHRLYRYRLRRVENEIGCSLPDISLSLELQEINDAYLRELEQQHATDFNQLVILTLTHLYKNESLRQKWADRFDYIHIDEFQDTHLSEYLVVKELAKKKRNLMLVGDLDQTIYGWRGSEPHLIAKLIEQHFAPVKKYSLEINYRSQPEILAATTSFLKSLVSRATGELRSSLTTKEAGKPIDFFTAYNFAEEVSWTMNMIKELRHAAPECSIAVLVRGNNAVGKIAEVFETQNVPHVTADKFQFFKRQEVKDVLAHLKIIFNRYDLESAYRVIARPPRTIGPATMQEIIQEGGPAGLKVSDFLQFQNYRLIEPFDPLLQSYRAGRVVVLDTETTGIQPQRDEIVQVYARELENGIPGKEFHFYVKNTIPVGASEYVHKLSDAFLAENGRAPAEVLSELRDFIGTSIVVGHNVYFDIQMIVENGKRAGVEFTFERFYDTLDIARRLVVSDNYRLSTLCELLDLKIATHSADDDVDATIGLLEVLVDRLRAGKEKRIALFAKHTGRFIKLANSIAEWQKTVNERRPAEAMLRIWEESGLKEYYEKDPEADRRFKSIELMADIFSKQDASEKQPRQAMHDMIAFSSLHKDINFLGLEQGKIPIVSVHQVKGLEFDYVFILGLNQYKFPVYNTDLEEEKRVFYVALTRARKKLFLSCSRFNDWGKPCDKSEFIEYIDQGLINFIE